MRHEKILKYIKNCIGVFLISVGLSACFAMQAAGEEKQEEDNVLAEYQEYMARLEAIEYRSDITECGFEIVENQIFPIEIVGYAEVSVIPAFDKSYHRLALFW